MSSCCSDNHQKKDSGWGSWALIVCLFVFDLWPVALILLFLKLFAPDQEKKQTAPPLQTQAPDRPEKQQAARAQQAARSVVQSPAEKRSNSWFLKIAGLVLIYIGAFSFIGGTSFELWDLLRNLALAAGGVGMLVSSLIMDRAMRRYPRYLAVMGDQESVSLEEISRKLGYSEKQVIRDLQKMIDKKFFGGQAYLNMELGRFFRSGQANANFEKKQKAADQKPPRQAEEGYSGILRNIRRANDEIADPVLSGKIDRLEEITAKIFQAVEEDPKKKSRIDTFLNYYLPTTQKLLDSYAKFESTGIEGENLRQAKERIQKTMDSIIAGFEHQLDELYQADVMDVDSDIRVMETMLNRDTASVEKDFGLHEIHTEQSESPSVDLGGVAAQTQPDEKTAK